MSKDLYYRAEALRNKFKDSPELGDYVITVGMELSLEQADIYLHATQGDEVTIMWARCHQVWRIGTIRPDVAALAIEVAKSQLQSIADRTDLNHRLTRAAEQTAAAQVIDRNIRIRINQEGDRPDTEDVWSGGRWKKLHRRCTVDLHEGGGYLLSFKGKAGELLSKFFFYPKGVRLNAEAKPTYTNLADGVIMTETAIYLFDRRNIS